MNKRYADIINEIGKSSFDKNEFIKWLFNDSNDNPQSFNSELFENYKKIIVANMKKMKCARLKNRLNVIMDIYMIILWRLKLIIK